MPLIVIPAAMKQLKAMPKADASRILEALEQVSADLNTRFSFVTEMVGQPGTWRLRKGDWRAVSTIEGNDVVVTRIGNRRDIYR
jgi:mRNA interferase RelE/StbE